MMRAATALRARDTRPLERIGAALHARLTNEHVCGFSSKRRTRHGGETESRRTNKLFSALRVKQQEQLMRLRESLAREEREAAAQVKRMEEMEAAASDTRVENAAEQHAARHHKQTREFERMMARKAARKDRVKHLPLFREDSPLLKRFGARTLLDYDGLPEIGFEGPVTVIHSADEEKVHRAYLSMQRIIGIDTESMPRFDHRKRANPVCLLQVATLDRSFLYRLPPGGPLPPYIRTMLESQSIVKVGHSLDDDIRLLEKSNLVSAVQTTIDTLPIATKLGCLRPGLQTLCQLFLGGSISKEMQVSNWEAVMLSENQVRYAATDAWAPLRVMLALIQMEDSKTLFRVKSYSSTRGNAVNGNVDRVIGMLEEYWLEHRSKL
ncbi:hypothetical protein Poli38472_008979 [Pythium oligandrum]|uniref:3'-5' exonuclease domain-containing protein n=1 Tax=Pythium oligandrum TaxID=41045 RepID=A0A8K1CM19_PYTOL|nr:hypothetical protein Poli38472_008979 [Pythium oligandrum]|eukprot:TMW64812.1 hypothetical protein Poli38472_008979 [Pythium oligandrum]